VGGTLADVEATIRRVSAPQLLGESPPVGGILAGRYLIRSLLGRGGMGEVYAARDQLLERDVAVKILPLVASRDRRAVTRLRREARAAAGLTHPGIVAVHDLVVADDHAFIVMELVRGRSLSRMLDDGTPFLPVLAIRIARDVAEALSYAHARGVIHRDIAPGNVIIDPDGGAKVLDFGLARAEDWTPAFDPSSSPLGTVAYISPEQADGRHGDARSDVYSLGCVLYEMLTGRPPFEGPSAAAIAAQHVHSSVVPPSMLRPAVPRDLDRVVLRCLTKDPRQRFPSGTELAAALEDIARSRSERPTQRIRRGAHTVPMPTGGTHSEATIPARPASSTLGRWVAGVVVVVVTALLATLVLPTARLLIWPPQPEPLPHRPRPVVPPTDVVAEGVCDGFMRSRADISWVPSSSAATGYDVFRSTSSIGRFEFLARVQGRDAASFHDVALGMGKTYYYVVRSVAGRRLSPLTDTTSAHTPLLCLG
jgi:serine/threonine protein kinase